MHRKRSIRGMAAIAAALMITAAGSASREQASGRKDRILTLTVWIYGSGEDRCNAMTNDPRDGPGNTVRRYVLNDAATAHCMGTTRYRVVAIRKDADGGLVELEKLDSACPAIGISGGGSVRSSYDYQSAYGGGTEWKRSEAAWTYVMGQLDRPWRGPELSFHSSGDFEISPQALPVSSPPSQAEGQGYEESRRVPRHDYTSGFPTGGRSAIGEALNDGLYDDKSFQENLKGRVDWSKPVSVSGHATQSVSTEHPVVLVEVGGEKISGGNEVRRGTVDVFWTVSDEPSAVEMDLIPGTVYESWMPRGGKDEKTPGSTFNVGIEIHKTGQPGVAPEAEVKKLKVWLADTSRQPGICMNVPKVEKASSDHDFKIRQTAGWTVNKEGQEAEADDPGLKSTVFLNCYDYGGWTQVMAAAELADGRIVVGQVKGGSKSSQLAVPKDDNRNRIADTWEAGRTAIDATADTDAFPAGNGVEGDGLSRYEEYRGFMSKSVHIRTDPVQKDLFIHDPGNLGIGFFGKSGITVHFVDKDEFDQEAGFTNTNVINGNRDFAALGPQHLLVLKNMNLGGAYTGMAFGTRDPGVPRTRSIVAVDKVRAQAPGEAGLAAIVAHELAHGCNVWHHGDIDYEACDLERLGKDDGEWHPVGGRGESGIVVAAPGGEESGVEECIMRYITTTAGAYERADGDLRWHKKSGKDPWIRGTWTPTREEHPYLFCTKPGGTGINDPANPGGPLAGDATKGDCLHQIQVNDLKPVK